MTHDELLEKAQSESADRGGASIAALIAVLELHKPVQGSSDIQTYDYIGCDACFEWSHDGNMNVEYPCTTIQAIEKELA